MSGYLFAVGLSVLVIGLLFFLLRTRRIREKYAGIWIALAAAVVIVSIFPQLAFWLSRVFGVNTPVNLVFATAFVVLLLVCIQLSAEVSNLEEETRTLAEEIALLRLEVSELAERQRAAETGPDPGSARD
ncbi:DUF2304 domain-containing protein [uncultured Cellulomonas sp.]|uniref:DUF2304 domain-containing protein n=1 Tax=uncultured Cellulomonas sp. TaxID=189682 RepID=UPI0028EFA5F8|nr:DUF2304 domain-containing protein [uncultured Cellulomonas sp.]